MIGVKPTRLLTLIALIATSAACTPSAAQNGDARQQTPGRGRNIDHVAPVRDSIGAAPTRFTWTAIDGAELYAIGIWNEVDQLIWRQDNVPTTSVTLPDDVRLEPGTYFWTVSALREGSQIAESGLAAFVVRTAP
jgi:hypothetical protein